MSHSSGKQGPRKFKITHSSVGYEGGNYSANKSGIPLSAAQRVASTLFMMARNEKSKASWKKFETKDELIKFTIRETTRGSDKDEYQYEAKIHHLPASQQKTVKRGDVEYTIKFKIVTRASRYTKMPFGGKGEFF
jgi:hypothetical protein